jgi:phage tail protein X|tara:strand:+ start:889 stop:1194 length:306 start_codon:yes stop_codon:yes gene_type:complete
MANRSENIPIQTNINGRRYYKNAFYPSIPLSSNDIYVITLEGDRLDLIANQYYGDPSLWWIISTANSGVPKSSLYIPVGTQLRIPQNINEIKNKYLQINQL